MERITRDEALKKLLERYVGYYDILPISEDEPYLAAECAFHAHSEKYVLSKKAKLWEAGSHEYVYVFSMPHLTEEIYRACQTRAYEEGMAQIQPGPTHMYSYITAIFLCDTCEESVKKAIRKCRIYKSFRLSFWGWMDYHNGLAVLEEGRAYANASGRSAAQLLETTLFYKERKKLFGKEKSL